MQYQLSGQAQQKAQCGDVLRCAGCRMQDVGKSKADIAAERIMAHIKSMPLMPHFCGMKGDPQDEAGQ